MTNEELQKGDLDAINLLHDIVEESYVAAGTQPLKPVTRAACQRILRATGYLLCTYFPFGGRNL